MPRAQCVEMVSDSRKRTFLDRDPRPMASAQGLLVANGEGRW